MFGSNKKLKAKIAEKDRAIASYNTRVAELEAQVAAWRDEYDKVEQMASEMYLLLDDIQARKMPNGAYMLNQRKGSGVAKRLHEWKWREKTND